MRKSACSNFTNNSYFLNLTSLNSFVFAGMHLKGVHLRTVNDTLQDKVVSVLEKKCGSEFHCLAGWEARACVHSFLWRGRKALGRGLAIGCQSSSHISALSIYPWSHLPSSFRAGTEALNLGSTPCSPVACAPNYALSMNQVIHGISLLHMHVFMHMS